MLNNENICPCGSNKRFDKCCLPIIKQAAEASSPEALMRSRYSAYAHKEYQYLVETYAKATRAKVNIGHLSAGEDATKWLKLEVLNATENGDKGEVEFIAYYQINKNFYAMHERSRFVQEAGFWRYLDGDMLNNTGKINITRNQSCLCGSNIKFKKCCGK